jgi:glucokinase
MSREPATVVGIDIGGTKLLAVQLNGSGRVAAELVRDSPRDGQAVLGDVVSTAREMCDPTSVGRGALGLGIPGLVDEAGTVRFAPNLLGLVGTPLKEAVRGALPGWRVWIGNDATAACWGERAMGVARGADEVLMVTLGTGIGGGIISRGRLVEGAHRYAGEFGHMIVDPNGPQCPCGQRGCWERFASGAGLGGLGREMAVAGRAPRLVWLAGGDPEAVRGEHVTTAAAEGDRPALDIIGRFAWWVALGLANLANAFDPDLIVLGGGLATAGDLLIGPTRQAFERLVAAPSLRSVQIEMATLGARAGAIGAGLLAAEAA